MRINQLNRVQIPKAPFGWVRVPQTIFFEDDRLRTLARRRRTNTFRWGSRSGTSCADSNSKSMASIPDLPLNCVDDHNEGDEMRNMGGSKENEY
jgi:hypothetical protein